MTNAEVRFNNSLRPQKPEGSLGRTAQDGHLDSHTAPELWVRDTRRPGPIYIYIYIYTGHDCRHLPSAVPWISEDRLFYTVTSALKLDIAQRNAIDD